MAQERIEIHFKPTGDKALILAIKQLDVVTKKLAGQTSVYEKELKRLTRQQKKHNKTTLLGVKNQRLLGNAFATLRSKMLLFSFGVAIVGKTMQTLFGAFMEQEKAEKKLEQALGKVNTALLTQASELQKVSVFGDEAIIGVQAMIAAFTDDEEAINKATKATLDLAAAKGMDLKTAGDLVAKTLGSSTNSLSRYGVEVEGAVNSTARLTSLTHNISKLFGGQAYAATQTLAGQTAQLKNVLGDIGEQIGQYLSGQVSGLARNFLDAANAILEFTTRMNEVPAETLLRTFQKLGISTESLFNLEVLAKLQRYSKSLGDTSDAINKLIDDKHILDGTLKGVADTIKNYGVGWGNVTEYIDTVGLSTENYETALEKLQARSAAITSETKSLNSEILDNVTVTKDQIEEYQKKLDLYTDEQLAISELIGLVEVWLATQKKMKEFSLDATDVIPEKSKFVEAMENGAEGIKKGLEPVNKFILDNQKLITGYMELVSDLGSLLGEQASARIAEIDSEAQAEIQALNEVTDEKISILRQSRKFAKMTATQQAAAEKEIRDKAYEEEQKIEAKRAKDKKKATKAANAFIIAEFRVKQALKAKETIMNTAEAIAEASPNAWKIAAAAALGAGQLAVIMAQKPPKMSKGGLIGGNLHSQGGTIVEAERGEFVMSRDAVNTIGVENLNRMNRGVGGATNISFSGNVLSDDFIESEAIPKIKEAIRRGADLGAS